ncbi:hypothetical protein BOX15_Mlig031048g3 [Macrostomum lignano]|uniref:Sulfotransferase domain-containing protein n=1 Tax=Macrostomum lignano TaxID=282301 RepID=A0A267E142_9PLAT|nr:hypothetical protein BOX15_Mlig031048g3 [Macrostomum lignano]
MEPVLDASGQPISGIVHTPDAEGVTVKNRLWRGYYVSDFPEAEVRMDRLCEFSPRPDDVFIYAYLKCGTHWLHEICHFLLTGQAEVRPQPKELAMVEAADLEDLDKIPSPRVLNCHMRCSILPQRLVAGNKIIYVVRNPKDTAVSLYHHVAGIDDYEYKGSFKGFLGLFENGTMDAGSWFSHTRDFLTAMAREGGGNILMVEFERLKRDPESQIRRIARFLLDIDISDSLLTAICEKVSFKSMQKARSNDFKEFFNERASQHGFYRKGEVGDWRNYFDEESSLRIDRLCAEALAGFENLYQPIYE